MKWIFKTKSFMRSPPAGLMSLPNKTDEIKFWQAPMIFVHSCQIVPLFPSFSINFLLEMFWGHSMKNIYSERSQQISNLISLLPAQSCSMLRTLVDVFCWMLHLMRYIPTTEYRSVIFQPNSPTAHPIYLVNKEEEEEMGEKHILMLGFLSSQDIHNCKRWLYQPCHQTEIKKKHISIAYNKKHILSFQICLISMCSILVILL